MPSIVRQLQLGERGCGVVPTKHSHYLQVCRYHKIIDNPRYMKLSVFTLLFLLLLTGCDSNEPDPIVLPTPKPRFVADSSFTITPSGLKYFDFAIGDTTRVTADSGDVVLVHYDGWLADSTFIDTSTLTGPIQFTLGAGHVIAGWDEGLSGMYLGGERQLVIPPVLGYGSEDLGDIPPNSTLIYEVILLGTQ